MNIFSKSPFSCQCSAQGTSHTAARGRGQLGAATASEANSPSRERHGSKASHLPLCQHGGSDNRAHFAALTGISKPPESTARRRERDPQGAGRARCPRSRTQPPGDVMAPRAIEKLHLWATSAPVQLSASTAAFRKGHVAGPPLTKHSASQEGSSSDPVLAISHPH